MIFYATCRYAECTIARVFLLIKLSEVLLSVADGYTITDFAQDLVISTTIFTPSLIQFIICSIGIYNFCNSLFTSRIIIFLSKICSTTPDM